jgi:hypothetical protein
MDLFNIPTHISSIFRCPDIPSLLVYPLSIRVLSDHIPPFWARELQPNPVVEFGRHAPPLPLGSCPKKSVLMKQYQLRVGNSLNDEANVYLSTSDEYEDPVFLFISKRRFHCEGTKAKV